MSREDVDMTFSGPSWDTMSKNAGTDQALRFTRLANGKRVMMSVDQLGKFNKNGFEAVCLTDRDDYVTLHGYATHRGQPAKYAKIGR